MQLASYVGLFGLGVRVVVARHVAIASESGELAKRDGVVATALWLLIVAALVAATAVISHGDCRQMRFFSP